MTTTARGAVDAEFGDSRGLSSADYERHEPVDLLPCKGARTSDDASKAALTRENVCRRFLSFQVVFRLLRRPTAD